MNNKYLKRCVFLATFNSPSFFNFQTNFMKKILLIASISIFAFSSCDKDDDDTPKTNYTLSATANGAQEVPAVTTAATGTVSGTYNSSTNALSYTVTWTGLSGAPTLMHFHGPALAGEGSGLRRKCSYRPCWRCRQGSNYCHAGPQQRK